MAKTSITIAARNLRAVFILGTSLALAASTYATTVSGEQAPASAIVAAPATSTYLAPAISASPVVTPAVSTTATTTPAPNQNLTHKPLPTAKPRWAELTPAQQQALTPLAGEWDSLDAFRKNKWLAIGNKFPSMKPDEQQRVQERMRDWVRLTPEQKRMARESYARVKKLHPDQKSAQWEQYQQLPEEQKKKLAAAAAAASKKHVATVPPPATQDKNNRTTVPPIKSAPKPVLEKSVTPQAANQSALQPSVQPAK